MIRETWGRNSAIPFFFVLGEGCSSQRADELVFQGVADDYHSLPYKTREGHRWALQQGYAPILQAFTDVYLVTSKLAEQASQPLPASYVGNFGCPNPISREPDPKGHFAYASGGCGYWLDERASNVLCSAEPDHWAEDLWVGDVMGKAGIPAFHDPRYMRKCSQLGSQGQQREPLTIHLSRGTGIYDPRWMRTVHAGLRPTAEMLS